jgi:hypothetical protein
MIALVCHDAGGAEILSSWLLRCTEPYCLVLDGPAVAIFRRKFDDLVLFTLSDAIAKSDWVLCGSSWESNLERHAIAQARTLGKRTVVFLDHWVNFNERFLDRGEAIYPDELWVGDCEAEKIAQATFFGPKIVLTQNPYLDDLRLEFSKIKHSAGAGQKFSVLYVCEPIREHAFLRYGNERYWGYTEEDALMYFLENADALGCVVDEINIRPHPSEDHHKYKWVLQKTSRAIRIGGNKTLLEEISEATVIVGCESMAMVVALLAGKRVVSSIPPAGGLCALPHREIEHLQHLLGARGACD